MRIAGGEVAATFLSADIPIGITRDQRGDFDEKHTTASPRSIHCEH
jgi:hypothetical protein